MLKKNLRRTKSTCCGFLFVSTRLPCQHLCSFLVSKTNQDAFGVAQLYPRWSMKEALTVPPFVEGTLQHLRRVSNVTGVATQTPEPGILLAAKARIVYVKLKKGEKSESAVVSDCEKYNVARAESMPLLDDDTHDGLDMHDFQQAQSIEVSEAAQLYKNEGAVPSPGVSTQDDTIV
ncbi:unnamed protein product [Phytophthora fragariaefolia]|uniref:Unnamed protein product n=1 Tax=Phytophthora fragariaefolia TaxID=1490495 RepID=A0A9W7D7N8_9STRA|nr:unnamed protein product [Phytophthora fragariaefolia]